MGTIEKEDDHYIYRQDDGQITARFRSIEQKKVLRHEGSSFYRWVFNLLVLAGTVYLAVIFFLM
jgi:hypothetical protein